MTRRTNALLLLALSAACRASAPSATTGAGAVNSSGHSAATGASVSRTASPRLPATSSNAAGTSFELPLVQVADAPLPGRAVRFDYQDLDAAQGHLVIAHMNDASVVIVSSNDGSVVKVLSGIPVPRGVVVADDVGRIFVTSSPKKLVIIDNESLTEIARVETGNGPDGVAWDPVHQVVAVSDQADGAISLLGQAGRGKQRQIALGTETGNVVFDHTRSWFWITVRRGSSPDELVAVAPTAGQVVRRLALPGCNGAHGLRIHPDGKSALVACEDNSQVVRVDLDDAHSLSFAASGLAPDVMAIDPGLAWLYVAAESGDLRVFDLAQPGLVPLPGQHIAPAAHSVAVDAATHRVFFPLAAGPNGTPVLRILRPTVN